MKTAIPSRRTSHTGSALALTMVMTGVALLVLGGAMTWSANSTRLTYRYIQYNQSVAAAEAATEKVLSRLTRDFLYGGEEAVINNLGIYRQTVPTPSDSSYWSTWEFSDGNGNTSQTYVQGTTSSSYVVLNSTYAGLLAYTSTYTVVSHARDTAPWQNVVAGVLQQVQLARIPIFQFAIFYNMEMEISPGQPMNVIGPVHANGDMYTAPSGTLTFYDFVGISGQLYRTRDPNDPQANGTAPVNFNGGIETQDNVLNLPIGTANSNPTNLAAAILDPSPPGEDPNSAAGQVRFANTTDLVISNSASTNILVFFQDASYVPRLTLITGDVTFNTTNGSVVTTNGYFSFVTNVSFYDYREGKTVNAVQLDVGKLSAWLTNASATGGYNYNNQNSFDKGHNIDSVYIINNQPASSSILPAVRVSDGQTLPSSGLSVATPQPLYVYRDYNCPSWALGSTNTTGTYPAALIGDAITILSDNWSDNNYTPGTSLNSRNAYSTTVNVAVFAGIVPSQTVNGTKHYSGGVENFLRLLENWSGDTLTYNGSMVAMFYSRYGTNFWQSPGVYYNVPNRNWSFDLNFNDETKFPPLTPSLLEVIRSQWTTVAPNQNVATAVN
jgi:hypothetical protein